MPDHRESHTRVGGFSIAPLSWRVCIGVCLLGLSVPVPAQERVAPPRSVDPACSADCADRGYESEQCALMCSTVAVEGERQLPAADRRCVHVCRSAGGALVDCIRRCPRGDG